MKSYSKIKLILILAFLLIFTSCSGNYSFEKNNYNDSSVYSGKVSVNHVQQNGKTQNYFIIKNGVKQLNLEAFPKKIGNYIRSSYFQNTTYYNGLRSYSLFYTNNLSKRNSRVTLDLTNKLNKKSIEDFRNYSYKFFKTKNDLIIRADPSSTLAYYFIKNSDFNFIEFGYLNYNYNSISEKTPKSEYKKIIETNLNEFENNEVINYFASKFISNSDLIKSFNFANRETVISNVLSEALQNLQNFQDLQISNFNTNITNKNYVQGAQFKYNNSHLYKQINPDGSWYDYSYLGNRIDLVKYFHSNKNIIYYQVIRNNGSWSKEIYDINTRNLLRVENSDGSIIKYDKNRTIINDTSNYDLIAWGISLNTSTENIVEGEPIHFTLHYSVNGVPSYKSNTNLTWAQGVFNIDNSNTNGVTVDFYKNGKNESFGYDWIATAGNHIATFTLKDFYNASEINYNNNKIKFNFTVNPKLSVGLSVFEVTANNTQDGLINRGIDSISTSFQLSPGSTPLKLSDLSVTLISNNGSYQYSYDPNNLFGSTNTFGVGAIRGSIQDGYFNSEDVLKLNIISAENIGENSQFTLRFFPANGNPLPISIVTPQVMTQKFTVLK